MRCGARLQVAEDERRLVQQSGQLRVAPGVLADGDRGEHARPGQRRRAGGRSGSGGGTGGGSGAGGVAVVPAARGRRAGDRRRRDRGGERAQREIASECAGLRPDVAEQAVQLRADVAGLGVAVGHAQQPFGPGRVDGQRPHLNAERAAVRAHGGRAQRREVDARAAAPAEPGPGLDLHRPEPALGPPAEREPELGAGHSGAPARARAMPRRTCRCGSGEPALDTAEV